MDESLHIICPQCETINRVPASRLTEEPNCGQCKHRLFNAHPVELTGANFRKHIEKSDIPVVVDFWAPWCGPCKMMGPIYEKAAAQLEPQVRLTKLNTEKEQAMAGQFGIQSIPTLVIFKRGKEIVRRSGAMDIGSLIQWVKAHT